MPNKTNLEEIRKKLPVPDYGKYKDSIDRLRNMLEAIQIPSYLDENLNPVTEAQNDDSEYYHHSADLYQTCNSITEDLKKAKEQLALFCDPQDNSENKNVRWESVQKAVNRIVDGQKALEDGIKAHPQKFEVLRNTDICKVKSAATAMQTVKMRMDALNDIQIAESYHELKREYDREHEDWKKKQQELLRDNPGKSLYFGTESNMEDLNKTNEEIKKAQKRLEELQTGNYQSEMIRLGTEAQKERDIINENMKATLEEKKNLITQLELIREKQKLLKDSFQEEDRLMNEVDQIQKSIVEEMENKGEKERVYMELLGKINGNEQKLREVVNSDKCLKENYEQQNKVESMNRLANDYQELISDPEFSVVMSFIRPNLEKCKTMEQVGVNEKRLAILKRFEEISNSFPEKNVFSKVKNKKNCTSQEYTDVYQAMKAAQEKEKEKLIQYQQEMGKKNLWFQWDEVKGIRDEIQALQQIADTQKQGIAELDNKIEQAGKDKLYVGHQLNKLVTDRARESYIVLRSLNLDEDITEKELQNIDFPEKYKVQKTLLEEYENNCRDKEEAIQRNDIKYEKLEEKYSNVQEVLYTLGKKEADEEIKKQENRLANLKHQKKQIEDKMKRVGELYGSYLKQRELKNDLYSNFHAFEEGAETRDRIFKQARQFLSRFEDAQTQSGNSEYYSAIGTALIAICKMDPNHQNEKFPNFRDPLLNQAAEKTENSSGDLGAALQTLQNAVSTYQTKKKGQLFHWIPSTQRITRLQYADELLSFCDQSKQVLSEIKPDMTRKGFLEKVKGDINKRASSREEFEDFLTEQTLKMGRANDKQEENDIMNQSFQEEPKVKKSGMIRV